MMKYLRSKIRISFFVFVGLFVFSLVLFQNCNQVQFSNQPSRGQSAVPAEVAPSPDVITQPQPTPTTSPTPTSAVSLTPTTTPTPISTPTPTTTPHAPLKNDFCSQGNQNITVSDLPDSVSFTGYEYRDFVTKYSKGKSATFVIRRIDSDPGWEDLGLVGQAAVDHAWAIDSIFPNNSWQNIVVSINQNNIFNTLNKLKPNSVIAVGFWVIKMEDSGITKDISLEKNLAQCFTIIEQ